MADRTIQSGGSDGARVLSHKFEPPADPRDLARAWCEHIAPAFEVGLRPEADLSAPIAMQTYHLGDLIVGDVIAPAHVLERGSRMIERQGIDHILIQFYRRGQSTVERRDGSERVTEGQCVVFDLAQPVRIVAEPVDATNLVVPRARLEDQGCQVGGLHGRAFDYDGDPFGRLFHEFLANLVACGDLLHPREAAAGARALVQLCDTFLRGRAGNGPPQNLDARIRVRRFIERQLHDFDLGPAMIAAQLGLSRSTLYRLFGETGGVLAYIRDRRLMRAMRLLVRSDAAQPMRISQLAYAVGFADEKTFRRAFRRRFGFLPSEAMAYQLGPDDAGMPVLRRWFDNL
ncbi:transcriptional regulator, AraC family [Methylobacterium sp. 4-46]|uniref:helix-turn-helix domain-containing protein n=1 Tax=unclassified Methylobacterium TaxID=2615210 RepID=UPI000152E7BD|nr:MULTISPECIES: helix-turn-helix domain-containing protein [Methylobacterium]ACA15075.1 transcriptional regulator, AraC family [Methylobacterium sp. 4-46]WFT80811.1 helix-turn-helix domain-containing protein [Methylobacterium nodulans]